MRIQPLLLCAALLALLAACSPEQATPDQQGDLPLVKLGDASLRMEFALTSSQQQKGLMFRDGIADDHGMLFPFKTPKQASFYMKNVDFPIDIGYFTADGVLQEVYPLYARDEASRQSIRHDIAYALETSHGWYKRNDVRPGARLDLEAIDKAIAQIRK